MERRPHPTAGIGRVIPSVAASTVAASTVVALVLAGCTAPSDQPSARPSDRPSAQPAPEVTTFEPGRFDQLPQFPRSDPLGPPSEQDGVVTRSFEARGTTPEQVLEFYAGELGPRWSMVSGIEQLGVGTYRADWTTDEYALRVSATRESELEDDPSHTVPVAQYSLVLRPL